MGVIQLIFIGNASNLSYQLTIQHVFFYRPGGELMPGEDENEGLKRAMTEVLISYFVAYNPSLVSIKD